MDSRIEDSAEESLADASGYEKKTRNIKTDASCYGYSAKTQRAGIRTRDGVISEWILVSHQRLKTNPFVVRTNHDTSWYRQSSKPNRPDDHGRRDRWSCLQNWTTNPSVVRKDLDTLWCRQSSHWSRLGDHTDHDKSSCRRSWMTIRLVDHRDHETIACRPDCMQSRPDAQMNPGKSLCRYLLCSECFDGSYANCPSLTNEIRRRFVHARYPTAERNRLLQKTSPAQHAKSS